MVPLISLRRARAFAVLGFDVDDHVTDPAAGLQVLTGDVDPSSAKIWLIWFITPGLVAVNVQQAAGALWSAGDFREVDRGEGGAVVGGFDQLVATSRPMFSWASWVSRRWGSGSRCPGRAAGEELPSLDLGSTGKTSMAAPRGGRS